MQENNNNGSNKKEKASEELSDLIANAIANKKILENSADSPKKDDDEKIQKEKSEKISGQETAENNNKAVKKETPKTVSDQPLKPKIDSDAADKSDSKSSGKSGKPASAKTENKKSPNTANEKKSSDSKSLGSEKKSAEKKQSSSSKSQKSFKKKWASWNKKKKTSFVLGIVFIVLFVIVIIVVCMFLYYSGLLNRDTDTKINSGAAPIDSSLLVDESDTFDKAAKDEELKKMLANQSKPISDENVMNILLIGEDLRDTEEKGRGNTDVMILLSINKNNKTITMSSIMRDMYVYLDGYNDSNKINSAYWHGGAPLLTKTIKDYLGVKVDRYVMVNFYQFIKIVDAVGGIDIKVSDAEAEGMKAPMAEQNKYLKNKKGTDYLKKGGNLHLNGNQALAYAKLRYVGNADYERTERQRRVINEIVKKAKNLSLVEIDSLAKEVFPNIHTDITSGELAELLLNAFDFMNYDIQEVRIPVDNYFTSGVMNQMDVLLPDYTANAAILQKVIYGEATTVEEAAEEYEKELENGEDNSYNNQEEIEKYKNYNYLY